MIVSDAKSLCAGTLFHVFNCSTPNNERNVAWEGFCFSYYLFCLDIATLCFLSITFCCNNTITKYSMEHA